MGLFDWVDDVVPFLNPVTALSIGIPNAAVDSMGEGEAQPGVALPGEDPKTSYLRALQKRVSQEFNQGLEGNIAEGSALIREQGFAELDEQNRDTDRSMNRRGLLYSGKRQGAREKNAAGMAGAVARRAGEYEQGQRDLARDLEGDAISSEIEGVYDRNRMGEIQGGAYASELARRLRDKVQTGKAWGDLAGGIGSLTGIATGRA